MIRQSVIFDVGKVLFEWDLRHLFAKLIDNAGELEWFLGHVVTPEWHFQHDAGRPLADMVPERRAEFPDHAHLIDAYAARFNEPIPGPVPGSLDLVERLAAPGDRKSVVEGKSVSVREDLGGRRSFQKKKYTTHNKKTPHTNV